MGTLLELDGIKSDIGLSPGWYFSDAYFYDRGWKFKFPSDDFPYLVSINEDDMGGNKIIIRKWIEKNAEGVVIYCTENKSYRVWWSEDPKKRDWDHTSEIRNNWYMFYFEDSESALAFSLAFSNIVRPVTNDHPTKHYGERYVR